MPCSNIFQEKTDEEQDLILTDAPRIIIEAGSRQSWDRWLREGDSFIGMKGFGESAPAKDLFSYFKITTDKIYDEALKILE